MKRMIKIKLMQVIFISILLFSINLLAMSSTKDLKSPEDSLNPEYEKSAALMLSGKIIKKEEIWDRRSNPEMGRPDILKEILLHVKVDKVLKGKLLEKSKLITVSIKGHKSLIAYRMLKKGDSGTFYLNSKKIPYILLNFELSYSPPALPSKNENVRTDPVPKKNNFRPPYTDEKVDKMLGPPVRITGKMILESKDLQEKVIRKIAVRYGMKEAVIITLTSFQGPTPPSGGYKYWGVKGKIKGIWHVWQPHRKNPLIKGDKLIDPKRYQK